MLHNLRTMRLRYPKFFCNENGCTQENGMPTEYVHLNKARKHVRKTGHLVYPVVSLSPSDWTDSSGITVSVGLGNQ